MLHLLLIALFASMYAADALGDSVLGGRSAPGTVAALTLGAQGVLAAAVLLWGRVCAARLARTGKGVWVGRAHRAAGAARWAATGVHVCAVVGLGWLDAVRAVLGDWVLLDEAAAVAPALAVFIASWASFGMVERVLWSASLVRTLDEGRPLHGPRSAWAYGIEQCRMGAMIVLVPLALIWLWSESVAMGAVWLGVSMDSSAAQGAMAAAQLLGVAVAFVLTPPIMMRVWRTVSLGSGEMRERLRGLCVRHRVRCRDIRVWRTNGEMLNGAVIGIVAPVRYILLTDALLESLPEEQVEAVAAHEIAHIRRRHLPWLLAALVAAVWFGSAIVLIPFEVLSAATGWDTRGTALSLVAESVSVASSLVCAAVAFGFVSRAFERQADAFAVQSLSGLDTEAETHAMIGEGAATVMADALASVARFNAIPTQRFFWRHGSIGQRRRRLLALVGAPVARTPADRAARRIKAATLAAILLMACVEGTLAVLSMKG